MDRPERAIDRAKVRAAVRRMGKDYAYLMLEDAIELLPQAGLRQLFGQYIDVERRRLADDLNRLEDRQREHAILGEVLAGPRPDEAEGLAR